MVILDAPAGPDFGAVIEWADEHGKVHTRPAVATAIDTKAPVRRVRRCDPLDALGLDPTHHSAALVYRQAVEHMAAGKGMGPLPWGRDVAGGIGPGVWLGAQERALSAADWYRRGINAMGYGPSVGVVRWVIIDERGLRTFEAAMSWRNGRARGVLVEALERLAGAYGI